MLNAAARLIVACLACFYLCATTARGESPAAAPAPAVVEAPVPVPEPTARAVEYHRTGNMLWLAGMAWSFAVPLVILASGASVRMRDLAGRLRFGPLIVGGYVVLYILLTELVDLPLGYYLGYVRPHAYGLSVQTLGHWLGNVAKGTAVALVLAPLLAWIPFWLLRRSPRLWWLWAGLLVLPLLCLTLLAKPIAFDPLFNEFGPMKDRALEGRILDLASRAGIQGSRVFEVDKSRDTKTVNAYVTGFMGTKRIVLWDTLIAKLEPDEVLAVMGHEMGHYVLGHVVRSIALSTFGALLVLYAVHRLAGSALRRFGPSLGISVLHDPAALPLLAVLIQGVALLTSPVALAYSRAQEHEADRFSLELIRANRPAALAFAKLQGENLSIPYPHPLVKFWRSTHPSIGERIDFCNAYRPWETGQPLWYEGLFSAGGGSRPARSE
ncbi:M48 family metallopeptidase [Isosphaeraceae bacterium EP7]